jgi:hypothetical protein
VCGGRAGQQILLLWGEVEELSRGEGRVSVAFVSLGTPLWTGPGLVLLWLKLRFADVARRLLGQAGIVLVPSAVRRPRCAPGTGRVVSGLARDETCSRRADRRG